eukprot:scaffold7340_cov266-Pinguiococcus_pyrenoidosus.AAC.43
MLHLGHPGWEANSPPTGPQKFHVPKLRRTPAVDFEQGGTDFRCIGPYGASCFARQVLSLRSTVNDRRVVLGTVRTFLLDASFMLSHPASSCCPRNRRCGSRQSPIDPRGPSTGRLRDWSDRLCLSGGPPHW